MTTELCLILACGAILLALTLLSKNYLDPDELDADDPGECP
jgi:hypothetical protein